MNCPHWRIPSKRFEHPIEKVAAALLYDGAPSHYPTIDPGFDYTINHFFIEHVDTDLYEEYFVTDRMLDLTTHLRANGSLIGSYLMLDHMKTPFLRSDGGRVM